MSVVTGVVEVLEGLDLELPTHLLQAALVATGHAFQSCEYFGSVEDEDARGWWLVRELVRISGET